MNDAFIFVIIDFIKVDNTKRMSVEVVAMIIEIDTYYIQFKTFTYLRVASTIVNLKKLSRYPSDRLILFDISRQLTFTYDKVRK